MWKDSMKTNKVVWRFSRYLNTTLNYFNYNGRTAKKAYVLLNNVVDRVDWV